MSLLRNSPKVAEWIRRGRRPLGRRRPSKRKTRVRAFNKKRRSRQHRRNFDPLGNGSYRDFLIEQQGWKCACCPNNPIDQAHMIPRGMGGAGGGWYDTLMLCRSCHTSYDQQTATAFRATVGVSKGRLQARARRFAKSFVELHPEIASQIPRGLEVL